jgi:hypothetical protein
MTKYLPSTARTEFETSLGEIATVLPLLKSSRGLHADLKNYVLGASVIFLHAKLENYISDLFNGICQEACRVKLEATQIPESLLGWLFLADGHLERSRSFVARNDEYEFATKTGSYINNELLLGRTNYLQLERFKGIADKAYPSVKNLKRMFKRIGINNIFILLKARLKFDVELEIISLNGLRGSLAHSGLDGSLSYKDVKNHIDKIKRTVAALDKETFYHLRRTCPIVFWKSS